MSKKEQDAVSEKSESDLDSELGNLFDSEEEGETTPEGKIDPARAYSKIPVNLTLEVDSVEILMSDILNLAEGDTLPLTKKVGEPLDVRVNGRLIAQGEVVMVDGNYGLRLTDVFQNAKEKGGAA